MATVDRHHYLFGFTEGAADAALPEGPLGVPRTEPLDGGAFAVVSETSGPWSDDRLEDIEWIAPRALHHDEVLRAAVTFTVVPLRFGAVYRHRAGLEHAMRRIAPSLPPLFDGIRGKDEYRLTVLRRREPRPQDESGAAYLRRRRREHESSAGSSAQLVELAATHVAAVEPVRSDEHADTIDVLADAAQLHRLLRALHGSEATVDGPLPPYHFVRLAADGTVPA